MWDRSCDCFAVGTKEDGVTRNHYLALDAQLWPLMVLPGAAKQFSGAAKTAETQLNYDVGFSYSEAKEGLWTEGTAQAALFMELSGQETEAKSLLAAVGTMQAADGSYFASSTRDLPTGFMLETDPTQPRQYFHIAHLAAVSWTAIASHRLNPFTRNSLLP